MLLVNVLSRAEHSGKKLTQNFYGFFLKTIFYNYLKKKSQEFIHISIRRCAVRLDLSYDDVYEITSIEDGQNGCTTARTTIMIMIIVGTSLRIL